MEKVLFTESTKLPSADADIVFYNIDEPTSDKIIPSEDRLHQGQTQIPPGGIAILLETMEAYGGGSIKPLVQLVTKDITAESAAQQVLYIR